MGDVVERDWKLFRKRLPSWQERYMERIEREYLAILNGDGRASDKFWELEKRINEDKKCPGVVVHNASRSKMHLIIAELVLDDVITRDDLDGFTEDVTDYVDFILERNKKLNHA